MTEPLPWWEAAPDKAQIPVGLVRIELVRLDLDLRARARFAAGVEYIARAFDAMEPLAWEQEGVTLTLGGGAVERLPERAYLAAKELWERSFIDLDIDVRIGAHVGHVQLRADQTLDRDISKHLASVAPSRSIALSEDVGLALFGKVDDLAPLGTTKHLFMPAWVFPASAAPRRDAALFEEEGWSAFRRYALGKDVRDLRYVGFRLIKKEPPALDIREVFVPPRVELRPREEGPNHRLERSPVEPVERERSVPSRPIPVEELLPQHRSVVCLGDPGSGKTTLIRWLAVTAAGGGFLFGSKTGVFERLLPLPISVGRLAEVWREDRSVPVTTALARYFAARGVGDERDLSVFLERVLGRGQALVLLDGLDEVRSDERSRLHAWLLAFAAAHPQNRFVAASRVVGYSAFSLPSVAEVMIRPFDDAQVERYAKTFAMAYARWERGGDDEGKGEEEALKLLGSLKANERLMGIARNPFMLSALALVHRAEGRLPRHRVQAYEMFARALCETWAEARRLVAGEPAGATIAYEEEALPILGELALAMHLRYPTGVAPEAFVVETLANALRARQGVEGEAAARAFLERAGREVQILLERGAGSWGFLHLTFQEFFTAAGLHALERFEEEAFRHLFDPRWEEVLRLGVGYLALVQKRPEAAKRFVHKVLTYEAPEPHRWVTSVLKKQVPIAALLAAEAGDALPEAMKKQVAEALADWVCASPSPKRAEECLNELGHYELAGTMEASLVARVHGTENRSAAVRALGWLGTVSDACGLLELLDDEDASVRSAAVFALENIGIQGSEANLEVIATGPSPQARAAAVSLLIRSSNEPTTMLSRVLNDPAAEVRHTALFEVWFTRRNNPYFQWPPGLLLRVASDPSPLVRLLATYLLGEQSNKSTDIAGVLVGLATSDLDWNVRLTAARILKDAMPEEGAEALLAAFIESHESESPFVDQDAKSLASSPARLDIEQRALALLGSVNEHAIAGALRVLTYIKSEQADAALIAHTKHPSARVRRVALSGLLGEKKQRRELAIEALRDQDASVRKTAVSLMSAFSSATVSPLLLELVAHDESASVRCLALSLINHFELEERTRVLLSALSDPSEAVRSRAAYLLRTYQSSLVVPALLNALPTTPNAFRTLWLIAERLHTPEPVS